MRDFAGLIGTIVGALITLGGVWLTQRRTDVRERTKSERERIDRDLERTRQERLAVYAEFAGAITDLRRAAHDRWHRLRDDPDGPGFEAARDHYYRVYAVARNVQLKLRLLDDDADLVEAAQQAWERAAGIRDPDEDQERKQKGERAKDALDAFIGTASRRLRQPTQTEDTSRAAPS
ncbi:hypothetical protein [Actinoplanes sp. NPDC049118]|uniref:hypothetical protein n=1 Tax=Actinoplanes sp. NPDC049118 TaxID=3155769 RepID=UPI0033DB8FC3